MEDVTEDFVIVIILLGFKLIFAAIKLTDGTWPIRTEFFIWL